MNYITQQYFQSPYGELILGSYDGCLCLCDWRYRDRRAMVDRRLMQGLCAEYRQGDDDILQAAIQQLHEYFAGQRQQFDLPILLVGTPFQKTVWQALMQIPFGETLSYLQLAKNIDNVKAVRAVANANGANAMSIMIPCHRIIGSDGQLVGYAGGTEAKQALLSLEQKANDALNK